MNPIDKTAPSQTECISFEFDLHHSPEKVTLAPTASGTRLSLVQSGFKPDQKQNFGGARYGWKMMGGKLVDLLARIP
jgi:hypothetical protein